VKRPLRARRPPARVRLLAYALVVQVVLGTALVAVALDGFKVFGAGGHTRAPARPVGGPPPFEASRAFVDVRRQLGFGPRPTGSAALRRLAEELRRRLPGGRFETGPGGLRDIVGTLPGRRPGLALAAHYDTKDLPGFVGANDGAAGTAVVLELARVLAEDRPRDAPETRFLLFDGEEAPRGVPERDFVHFGLRGSKAYALRHARELRALILLDFVGNRRLSLPREATSDPALWARLRAAAGRAGAAGAFPNRTAGGIYDDHTPFERLGVPTIDLIDFAYPCFHRRCDDLAHVSLTSLGQAGAAVAELVRELERP